MAKARDARDLRCQLQRLKAPRQYPSGRLPRPIIYFLKAIRSCSLNHHLCGDPSLQMRIYKLHKSKFNAQKMQGASSARNDSSFLYSIVEKFAQFLALPFSLNSVRAQFWVITNISLYFSRIFSVFPIPFLRLLD